MTVAPEDVPVLDAVSGLTIAGAALDPVDSPARAAARALVAAAIEADVDPVLLQARLAQATAGRAAARADVERLELELADLKQRLVGMTAHCVAATKDTRAALAREGLALARLRAAESIPSVGVEVQIAEMRAAVDASFARLGHRELDEPRIIDDPDAVTPEVIARAIAKARDRGEVSAPLVALAGLVDAWISATKAHETAHQAAQRLGVAPGWLRAIDAAEAARAAMEACERALVRACSKAAP